MKKFIVAFRGLSLSFKHKAVMIQLINAIFVIIIGIILKLEYYEWIIFIVLIGLVIMAEIFNTCIEKICDFICDDYDSKIKDIKDISSASVLWISIIAFIIALIIFIKKIGG